MAQILVDGSNVLFWRGGQAQSEVPTLVVRALMLRRFAPIVYFDYTVSLHLSSLELTSLSKVAEINIAPRGTPADVLLLDACCDGRIQIVSCDRFSAWRTYYPRLKADWLVTGRVERGGRISFSKKLRAAPI
ncbi:hypothetical protein [uncultured Sulfitobacter sp.]|uniref:hypothetical protein n=1 Tax=uncultured Sulfitobacter sp. TaxID=191468 RepID=UPI00260EF60C|nr:hypothetical protein [uncultured Sulfitobacter sp.]